MIRTRSWDAVQAIACIQPTKICFTQLCKRSTKAENDKFNLFESRCVHKITRSLSESEYSYSELSTCTSYGLRQYVHTVTVHKMHAAGHDPYTSIVVQQN